MSSADPFNRALRTALKMWDTVPACRGNGYVYDEDGPADCQHCSNQGEVPPDRATYEAISNGD